MSPPDTNTKSRSLISMTEEFEAIRDSATQAVQDVFPITGKTRSLHLDKIWVPDTYKDAVEDIQGQLQAKLEERTWGVPIMGKLSLRDAGGKVLETQELRLADLPVPTPRQAYIVGGQEYQVDRQWRLKPGVYSRIKDNGELEAHINTAGGDRIAVEFDPTSRKFHMAYGGSTVPLMPVLKAAGLSEKDLRGAWGNDIFQANDAPTEKPFKKLLKITLGEESVTPGAVDRVRDFFESKALDPAVTELTLGKPVSRVDKEALVLTTQRLLGVARGDAAPDNRDALQFKTLHTTEDFIADKMRAYGTAVRRRLSNAVDRESSLGRVVYPNILGKAISSVFTDDAVSRIPTQDNPIEFLEGHTRTTLLGPGAISNTQMLTDEAQSVDPSQFGFLDPTDTPEGERVGVNAHLTLGAHKKGNEVHTPVFDLKKKRMTSLSPMEFLKAKIVLPDYVRWSGTKEHPVPQPLGKTVRILGPNNSVEDVSFDKADYVIPSTATLFGPASSLIPFIQNNSAVRINMAARHLSQAVPLKYRELPLVRAIPNAGSTESIDLPGRLSSHWSPVDGKITKIERGKIHVKEPDGTSRAVQIYDYFPLNDKKSGVHSEPVVKVGDQVKKGDLLADSSFTRDGKLAIGTMLRSGYISIPGLTYEDGVVISETAAAKLTSTHLHRASLDPHELTRIGKKAYAAYYPNRFGASQLAKLDEDGVIREGESINMGDPLTVSLREFKANSESQAIARLRKSLVKPYSDTAQSWEHEAPGKVVRVHKLPDGRVRIFVATEEPARVADKLCYDKETEVLTGSGWKLFRDVSMEDKIATRNERGELEFQRPTRLDVYPHKGEMYKIVTQEVDLLVTLDHQMYVRLPGDQSFKLVPAGDIIGKEAEYCFDCSEYLRYEWGEPGVRIEGIVHYEGTVYCCEVPNHVLWVRRNGKSVWSGNSGTFGNKGTIVEIRPDNEMPRTPDGKHIDMALNPMSVPSRMNIGQIYELIGGKIAQKTGQPYIARSFEPGVDWHERIQSDAAKHGVDEMEELLDPQSGKLPGKFLVGPVHTLKQRHLVEGKISARAGGAGYAYDIDRQPRRGGQEGGQAIGGLGNLALLAHGAREIIKETATTRSDMDQQDQLWRSIQMGQPLPPPKPTFAQKKFENYLNVLGVRLDKKGTRVQMIPVRDSEIIRMSSGEITKPNLLIRGHDLSPEPGGLFDPKITGGLDGDKVSHIKLPESIPNPFFERGVLALTGMKEGELLDMMGGKLAVSPNGGLTSPKDPGAISGSAGVQKLLQSVDVDKDIDRIREQLPRLSGQPLDKANKKLRYLEALKKANLDPVAAYMTSVIPVMPPSMRPVVPLPTGDIATDPLNETYKALGVTVQAFKALDPSLPERSRGRLRKELYTSLGALQGVGAGYKRVQGGETQGIMDIFIQPTAKHGWLQTRLFKARQDLSARSVIVPDPNMTMDEIGVPTRIASVIYKPFVVRELTRVGYSPLQAEQMLKNNDPVAEAMLQKVVDERPVLAKRDPVLHKYGIQAFKPKLIPGYAIKIHPLVTAGFGADFDGDEQHCAVFVAVKTEDFGGLTGATNGSIVPVGAEWWGMRRLEEGMTSRIRETVVACDGHDLYTMDLEDFPRAEKLRTKGHIDFHAVPPGLKVLAYDEETGKPCLAEVGGWSVHRDRKVVLVNLNSGRQIVTDDDPRAVYGLTRDLEVVRRRPLKAEGVFVPRLKEADISNEPEMMTDSIPIPKGDTRLRAEAQVDFRFGYLCGLLVGDGWAAHHKDIPRTINVAVTDPGVKEGFAWALLSMFVEAPNISMIDFTGPGLGGGPNSGRHTVSSTTAAKFIADLFGRGAANKHLPPFFAATSQRFRKGLLAGLLDTDGSISISHGKKKPQWMISYSSTSLRLVREVVHLLRSLGVGATITPSNTPAGKDFWMVGISTVDMHKAGAAGLFHSVKKARMDNFLSGPCPDDRFAYSRYDLVPVPSALADGVSKIITVGRNSTLYSTLRKACKTGSMSRYSAKRIIKMAQGEDGFPLPEKWVSLVLNEKVKWDPVMSYEDTGITETGYDLTVPGYETFMAVDGVILSNTMSLYVPISNAAVAESWKMMPSANLLNPSTGRPMYTPSMEMSLGLFRSTEIKDTKDAREFGSVDEVLAASGRGESAWDTVKVGGRPTTVGRAKVYMALPPEIRSDDILYDKSVQFNAKKINSLLSRVAKETPQQYAQVAQKLMETGAQNSYETGFSFSLADLKPDREVRERHFALARGEAQKIKSNPKLSPFEKEEQTISIWGKAGDAMEEEHWKKIRTSDSPGMLGQLTLAGTKPSADQYKQILLAPVIMTGVKGRVIPNPVTRSFAEGLDTAGFWVQSMAGRETARKKTQEVRDPGYLSKLMINTVADMVVAKDDCGTTDGVSLSVDHPDVHGRFLAKGSGGISAGTEVTADIVSKLRKDGTQNVVVRSALKCRLPQGLCSVCYGSGPEGRRPTIGTNIGVLAGQAIGERGTQLMLRSFHSGGIVAREKSVLSGFERTSQILRLPQQIPDASILAEVSGKVRRTEKDPAGGIRVFIDSGGRETEQHIPGTKTPIKGLRAGAFVTAGEPISSGNINMHDLLRTAGLDAVQNQITSELDDIYKGQGILRRNVEVVTRGVTNLGKVDDAGDNPYMRRGDLISLSVANAWNDQAKKEGSKPVRSSPILKGIQFAPLDLTEDWLAKLHHERIKDTLVDAALEGHESNISGYNPFSARAFSPAFGEGISGLPGAY